MKYLKYILPIALILIAFFAGRFSGDSKPDETLIKKFEQDRARDREAISDLREKLTATEAVEREIREKIAKRMAEKDSALKAERRVSTHYRKINEEINHSLNGATVPFLDSLRSVLRAGGPLPTH
jgi:TPP-dependent pyruvate/acetoin dehydrogenase alpha subunit